MGYMKKHGTLDAGRRVDRVLSRIAQYFASGVFTYKNGNPPTTDDFTPWPREKPPEIEGSIDDVFNLLASLGKANGK